MGIITSFEFWPWVARKDYLWCKERLFRGEPINYETVDQNVLYIGKNTNQLQSKHSHEGDTCTEWTYCFYEQWERTYF